MEVTTNGRVTIPHEIRQRLGIRPGTELEFRVEGESVRMMPVRGKRFRGGSLVDHMRGRATAPITTAEAMKITRGR